MGYKGKASLRRVCDMTTQNNVSVPQMLLPGGGGGHLGIFWVDMCRPGLQIGTRSKNNFP